MSNLHKYHSRKYEKKDFQQLLNIFIDFQEKSGLRVFASVDKNSIFYEMNIRQKLIEKLNYCHTVVVLFDEETIVGAVFFAKGQEFNFIDFMIKNPKYKYDTEMKDHLFQSIKDYVGFPVYAALDKREKFEKYVNFVKRKTNHKIIGKDSMGKTLIKIYEDKNT